MLKGPWKDFIFCGVSMIIKLDFSVSMTSRFAVNHREMEERQWLSLLQASSMVFPQQVTVVSSACMASSESEVLRERSFI